MTRLKNPLFSLAASGSIGRVLTFIKRRGIALAENKPTPHDAQTQEQLTWRSMYQKCAILWTSLGTAEKVAWHALASPRGMSGFNYFQSQCLRPNPGIYLPLAGGEMKGDIDMEGYSVLDLPAPTLPADAARKSYVDAAVASVTLNQGARVTHSVDQAIADNAWDTPHFDTEIYDSDNIHDNVTNNSRLTCQTDGVYIIAFHGYLWPFAAGHNYVNIILNQTDVICALFAVRDNDDFQPYMLSTLYRLTVGDFVEIRIHQQSGAAKDLLVVAHYNPIFMMQRIGL